MQTYFSRPTPFRFSLILLSFLLSAMSFLSCSNTSQEAYYTRKTIRHCGCDISCFQKNENIKVDKNTYDRKCGRK